MSLVKRLIERLYPTKNDLSIGIFGDNWSGKSSVAATLEGRPNAKYANLGFRCSPAVISTTSGKPLEVQIYDFGIGCGGLTSMGLLYTPIISWTDALIWVVDSTEPARIHHSKNALMTIVDAVEGTRVHRGKQKKFPVLLLANKQDLPNAMSLDDIRKEFKDFTSFHVCMVLATSANKPYAESGLPHGIDWLQIMLENPSLLTRAPAAAEPEKPKYSKELTEKIESWIEKLDKDVDAEEFIRLFDTFKLPSWDHYTHIRIAYLLLTMYGRQKGKDMIFDGLKAYIEQSPVKTGRAFHFTMTYFWIQVVHLGIQNVATRNVAESQEKTPPTLSSTEKDEFARFLLLNPYVADGSLWSNYYSVECMMGPTAKSSMVLPDKKPLPNLVVRDAI